jgi:benzodiazapine receptor
MNVIGVIVTIVVNGLANVIPFNGQTTAAASDIFPVFIVPAGYVFAICGMI